MRLTSLFACTVLTVSLAAHATPVIDQQNTAYNSFLGPSVAPGQSFTPTLNGIDFATFQLSVTSPALIFADVYYGDGFSGPLVGISTPLLVSSLTQFDPYTFLFSSTVSLTPGSVYTLELNDGLGNLYELESSGNQYAGGTEYDSAGIAQTGYDLTFSEGVNSATAAPVPEPSSIALLGTGLLGVAGAVRRRIAKR